ncbi:Gfo/Idh/MocA family protein [Sagittula sp. SSi028]|uniref:Gfo/Idh/MocA family protein n=1 Tax=Sagittula sp. SSi028 TaxID=3400636 RepID=UPI003AF92625
MSVLKVLIAGTGFAAEGHVAAFRAAGAEVVGIVGRTPDVLAQVAARHGISWSGTDWLTALEVCQPDIVSIATPGGAHAVPIRQALDHGCHVFCEKPLAPDAPTARALWDQARKAQVKTAFAASFRYTPGVRHAARLVAEGAIGHPTEVECVSHFNLERGIPFGWSHRAEEGGGRLANNFTHTLGIVEAVLGGRVTSVCGDLRDDLKRAPIVSGVHNFATRRAHIPDNLDDPDLEWGASNVEWSYSVLGRLRSPLASDSVSVLFRHGGLIPRFNKDYIAFYGDRGAIHLGGHYGSGPLNLHDGTGWREIDTPRDIAEAAQGISGETEQCWHHLAGLFVSDILGAGADPYPTFADGYHAQNIIDTLRAGTAWTTLDLPEGLA